MMVIEYHDIQAIRKTLLDIDYQGIEQNELVKKTCDHERNKLIGLPYFFVIYDYELSKVLYVSPSISHILGLTEDQVIKNGEALIFNCTCEKEKDYLLEVGECLYKEYYNSKPKVISESLYNIIYRMLGLDGQILPVLHQNEVLTFTSENRPKVIIMRFIDIRTIESEGQRKYVQFYTINRKSNEITPLYKKEVKIPVDPRLTPREKEIEAFVNQGFTSKQIALKLGISIETVSTHRKNINRKRNELAL